MILGIGNDLCDIKRIEKSLARFGDRFVQRIFTPVEQSRSEGRATRAASYAKRFAAKEACSKALGTGLRMGIAWRDMAVTNLPTGQPVMAALCQVLEKWIAHFLGIHVRIATEKQINDDHWVWHVGLDAQASGVLNDLYQGKEVDAERMERLLCLFKLEFVEPNDMLAEVRGKPVYLAMAVDANQRLKLKPQNLLLNLPLAQRS